MTVRVATSAYAEQLLRGGMLNCRLVVTEAVLAWLLEPPSVRVNVWPCVFWGGAGGGHQQA